MKYLKISLLALGLISLCSHSLANEQASGYNKVRIENEYKLSLPVDKIDELWAYLASQYANNEELFLKKYDRSFSTKLSTELFDDVYFDTASKDMLNMQGGIRRRTRFIPDDVQNRKHGRSLLQIKLNREGDRDSNRSEIKFPVNPKLALGQGNSNGPLALLDKDKHKRNFVERVKELGINPLELKEMLTIDQVRRRVYISNSEGPFATITLDEVSSKKWWVDVKLAEVELELNENKYTDSSDEQQKIMQEVNDFLLNDLQKKFDWVKVDQLPKYNKVYNAMSEHTLFAFIHKIGIIF
jgi:adenylate cyclase class IV